MPKALMIWGGWDGHEPQACTERFAGVLSDLGFEVSVYDHLDVLCDAELLASQDLIVPLWTMGEISKEQSQGLRDAILGGVGLGGWHGGMCDAFRKDIDYQFMTGGQWVQHPGGVIDFHVDVLDQTHPITEGISGFDLHSEQYYMHVDPSNTVLATTRFAGDQQGMDWIAGVSMPVVWTRTYGKARVFYASFGHVLADFDVPEAQEIVRRGLCWAARQDHLIAPSAAETIAAGPGA
jgi:type 1 glutamine amidotransferase